MIELLNIIASKIFSGGFESLLALLILVLIGVVWFAYHLLNDRQKLLEERNEMVQRYQDKLMEVVEKSHISQSMTTSAIHEIRIVLAEIKAKQ